MMSLLLATLVGLMVPGQTNAADQRPTSIVRMTDGATVYYGYVKDDGGKTIEITFDSGPQAGQKKYLSRSKVESVDLEPRTARDERLLKTVEAAQQRLDESGLVSVAPNKLVKKEEVEFANRAKAMVAERESRQSAARDPAPAPATESAAPQSNEAGPPTPPHGFLKQWGGHIVVAAIGLTLSALIIKTLLV